MRIRNAPLDLGPIDPVFRLPQVIKLVGLGRSSIFTAVRERRFPSPIRLGPRAVGWRRSALQAWLDARQPSREEGGRDE